MSPISEYFKGKGSEVMDKMKKNYGDKKRRISLLRDR